MISLASVTIFFTLPGISEIGLALFKRSGKVAEAKDAGSFAWLWVVTGVSIFLVNYVHFA